MRPHYILALATLISFAQPALSQSIQGFNLDIFEGDVIYQSGGGGTVLTASDLGTQFIMPADFANILVNGQFISGPSGGFVPGLQLSPYAQANMSLLTGVSDDYFINNAMVGEPGAFLDHNGNVTDYPNPFTDADQLALISSDLEGLLPGYTVASSTVVLTDNVQYLADYAVLGANGPVVNVNYYTDTIVETAPDGGATASMLALVLLGLIVGRSFPRSKSVA